MIYELINSTLVNLSILVKDTLSKCPDKIELGNFPFPVILFAMINSRKEVNRNEFDWQKFSHIKGFLSRGDFLSVGIIGRIKG